MAYEIGQSATISSLLPTIRPTNEETENGNDGIH